MAVRFLPKKIPVGVENNTEFALNFVVAKRSCRPMIPELGRNGESLSSLKQHEKSWDSLNLPGLFQKLFPKGNTPQYGEDCPYEDNIPSCDAPLTAIGGFGAEHTNFDHEL